MEFEEFFDNRIPLEERVEKYAEPHKRDAKERFNKWLINVYNEAPKNPSYILGMSYINLTGIPASPELRPYYVHFADAIMEILYEPEDLMRLFDYLHCCFTSIQDGKKEMNLEEKIILDYLKNFTKERVEKYSKEFRKKIGLD
ncbi:hypothetical protein J4221_02980 [Candidatus Pacearchaeota archaeon]|nr:hypothetical protein [Candidatus Pacearchaeota archaeon]